MKKNNKKASILLWSVMLSLIIAITFINISTKINKNIKLSGQINNFIDNKNKIDFSMNSGSIIDISDNKLLIIPDSKERIFSLKKQEELNLFFTGANDFNIDINIINGGALNYNYIKNDNSISASGVINISKSFTGKLNNNSGSLKILNLGGNTRFEIKSENEFETSIKKYKIVTKIGNQLFNETKNEK